MASPCVDTHLAIFFKKVVRLIDRSAASLQTGAKKYYQVKIV
jgi:hypothetical protein